MLLITLLLFNSITVQGESTFGFECEFQKGEKIYTDKNGPLKVIDPFNKYLADDVDKEASGLLEVNSIVFRGKDAKNEMFSRMEDLQKAIGKDDVSSFQVHMRFDKKEVKDINNFRAWLARLNDWIFVKRINYFIEQEYVYRSASNRRLTVDELVDGQASGRGTIRFAPDNSPGNKASKPRQGGPI